MKVFSIVVRRWLKAVGMGIVLLGLSRGVGLAGSREPTATAAEVIGAATCLSCHTAREDFKTNIHAKVFPTRKGISFEQSCETCHGPGSLHAAAGGDRADPGFATIQDPKHLSAVSSSQTCLQCHEDSTRMHWQGSRHESRDVSCVSCHSVHGAKESKHLLIQSSVVEVCFQCHKDIKAQTRRSAHMPLREGKMSCVDCHNPHGAAAPKMVKADSTASLCYSCHADKRGPFLWEHMPVRENCLNCHTPHGSHHDKMLVAKPPFLCQRCHIGTRHPSTPYDQTDIDGQHNRILVQACLNCHSNIHGSNHPSGKFFLR